VKQIYAAHYLLVPILQRNTERRNLVHLPTPSALQIFETVDGILFEVYGYKMFTMVNAL